MLKSVKVLDLTRVLAGPLCTMILGDLGADVIKVERPGGGDETRGWGPPFDPDGQSAYYLSVNRNKLGITADLGDPVDGGHVTELIGTADVVVDNFLPGVLARHEMDPQEMLRRFPRLIWCTIGGFEPGSQRPGYDYVVQAESGWMSITGEPDGAPMKHGIALVDVLAGKDAAIGILAALVARGTTNAGRHLHISLMESARAALVNVAQNALVSGVPPARWGNAHANLVPYQLFESADRPLVIAVGSDGQWQDCATALGLSSLAADAGLATNAGRLAGRDRVVRALATRLRERPAAEWIATLRAVGVPCGVVRTVLEALTEVDGSALTGMPSSVTGLIRTPPPRLGEHSALVRRVGWGAFSAI